MVAYTQKDPAIEIKRFSPLLFDLQTHFLQVKTLSKSDNLGADELNQISVISKHALDIIDYALFAVDSKQTALELTTLSAGAIAQDVASSLYMLAKTYDVDLDIDVTKKLEPIYANESAVKGVLYGLAASIITSGHSSGKKKRPRLVIAAQETTPKTQRLGLYSSNVSISPSILKESSRLSSQARSAAPSKFHHSGLGLVVSDSLCRLIGSDLKRFEHRGNKGIGFYVPISKQIAFV